jgi:hypothetical protein
MDNANINTPRVPQPTAYEQGVSEYRGKKTRKELVAARAHFRRHEIYVLALMPSGEYLPLNRFYKPLGMTGKDGWVDYLRYETLALSHDRVWACASHIGPVSVLPDAARNFHLYSDSIHPLSSEDNKRRYNVRLRLLDLGFPASAGATYLLSRFELSRIDEIRHSNFDRLAAEMAEAEISKLT